MSQILFFFKIEICKHRANYAVFQTSRCLFFFVPKSHFGNVFTWLSCSFSLLIMFPAAMFLQVTVRMYKRGPRGWLGKSLNATTTIPSNTFVIFRVSGEEADSRIPANTIHSITLSM